MARSTSQRGNLEQGLQNSIVSITPVAYWQDTSSHSIPRLRVLCTRYAIHAANVGAMAAGLTRRGYALLNPCSQIRSPRLSRLCCTFEQATACGVLTTIFSGPAVRLSPPSYRTRSSGEGPRTAKHVPWLHHTMVAKNAIAPCAAK